MHGSIPKPPRTRKVVLHPSLWLEGWKPCLTEHPPPPTHHQLHPTGKTSLDWVSVVEQLSFHTLGPARRVPQQIPLGSQNDTMLISANTLVANWVLGPVEAVPKQTCYTCMKTTVVACGYICMNGNNVVKLSDGTRPRAKRQLTAGTKAPKGCTFGTKSNIRQIKP